jgi:hypothetical protein
VTVAYPIPLTVFSAISAIAAVIVAGIFIAFPIAMAVTDQCLRASRNAVAVRCTTIAVVPAAGFYVAGILANVIRYPGRGAPRSTVTVPPVIKAVRDVAYLVTYTVVLQVGALRWAFFVFGRIAFAANPEVGGQRQDCY